MRNKAIQIENGGKDKESHEYIQMANEHENKLKIVSH